MSDAKLVCFLCGRTPEEIPEYAEAVEFEGETATDFVMNEEGTYNVHANTFACTDCYVAIGCPSSPSGWIAPDRRQS